tara:strand:+ start:180 stop:776 length:597 start_codon:yes stop_codon:yes gene_type:complete
MTKLDQSYWEERYSQGNTGWDIGHPSPPLVQYIDQIKDKSISILIPGAGKGYEAIYLYQNGFFNINVVDLAQNPLKHIKNRLPHFPQEQLIQTDFFEHTGKYDLIFEQTFFCALSPAKRPAYAKKMHELLKPDGKIAGVLFNFALSEKGPPFGGSLNEYKELFTPLFNIRKLEPCYNSIKPRAGSELFFIFEKLNTKS